MNEFKKVRTYKDIKNDPRVDRVYRERDGFFGDEDNPKGNIWVELKYGYKNVESGSGTIHEPTVATVCHIMNNDVVEGIDDYAPDREREQFNSNRDKYRVESNQKINTGDNHE